MSYKHIDLTNQEIDDYLKFCDRRIMWKDHTKKSDENLLNGAIVRPLKTLTTSHYWIKRNMVSIPQSNLVCYLSGGCLVVSSLNESDSEDIQTIIKLKSDATVTSLFSQISSTSEKIIIVGMKIKPPSNDQEVVTNNTGIYSGLVEIHNLDKKILDEKRVLDHSFYVSYESFIFDAKVPYNSEYCYTILKNSNPAESDTKLFVWDYVNNSLLAIHDFENHIENIIFNPFHPNQYIIYSLFYVAMWSFSHTKKKFNLENVYVNDNREITDVTFYTTENMRGICISYQSFNIIEFYNEAYEILRSLNLQDVYNGLSRSLNIKSNQNQSTPNTSLLKSKSEDYTSNSLSQNSFSKEEEYDFSQEILDLIKDSQTLNMSEIQQVFKNGMIGPKSYIKYLIFRNNYLFIFFYDTKIYFIIEIGYKDSSLNFKLVSIENLNYEIVDSSSIILNETNGYLLHIHGKTSPFEEFKKTVFIQSKERRKMTDLFAFGAKNKEVEIIKHYLYKMRIRYFMYKLNFNSTCPKLEYQEELFPYSATGQQLINFAVSVNPRIILAGFNNKILTIFQQNNIDDLNIKIVRHTISGMNNNSFNFSSFSGFESISQMASNHFQENIQKLTKTVPINSRKCECQSVNIALSPFGNIFFVTSEETTFLYALLDKEVKELMKTNSYCYSAAFSKSGKYLAFSYADSKTERQEYTIFILNTVNFEVEYIITKLTLPVKLIWADNDTKILAQFQETSVVILAWRLTDCRYIENLSKENKVVKYKENSDEIEDDSCEILRIQDFPDKIIDLAWDDVLNYIVICTDEKKVYLIKKMISDKEDLRTEFPTPFKYTCLLLVRKLDIILFGTSEGSVRTLLWPITSFPFKEHIQHPQFSECFMHSESVVNLIISPDLQFIYSASSDGSIFISSIQAVSNDSLVSINSFASFDNKNFLPKKIHMNYADLIYMTDSVYRTKLENIEKRQTQIQTINSEYMTEIDKLSGENTKEIDRKRNEMNDEIENKRRTVKSLEDEKETLSKRLKDQRQEQVKKFRDEIAKMKSDNDDRIGALARKNQELSNYRDSFKSQYLVQIAEIEKKREETNNKMKTFLNNLLNELTLKYVDLEKLIDSKNLNFRSDMDKVETQYEGKIREKEMLYKSVVKHNENEKEKLEREISKIRKDNLNSDEKIKEWDNHLKELKNNNNDLMESHLFNYLKLKHMSGQLAENEKDISKNEKEVKHQRTINDRLEQLRYVLEYQIKNLIKEKTPIEEQIQSFEELHNDFNKRFNLLYDEQLNIDDFISSNDELIKKFKSQLTHKKKTLYNLKNLYRTIDLEINFIFKNKLDFKKPIMNKLIEIYKKNLKDYSEDVNNSSYVNENKLLSKFVDKEINKQKNKVLKDLIKKRQDRKDINIEKEELMGSIRIENQQLIDECSSIRMNLEDILKYINDIEKKFIELTNTNLFLHKNEDTQLIRKEIKNVKQSILLADIDKTRIARGNLHANSDKSLLNNEEVLFSDKNHHLNIIKKLEENKDEMKLQNLQIEKMQNKIRDIIGRPSNNPLGIEINKVEESPKKEHIAIRSCKLIF
jgi:hypothetical protein